jgi:hypothetical protein
VHLITAPSQSTMCFRWVCTSIQENWYYVTFHRPWSDGTTGITLASLELLEQLGACVSLPRVHLVRSAGCLAPLSKLRDAIMSTPRQQGVDGEEKKTGRRREPRIGTGPGCWAASLLWIWRPVFRHGVGGGSLATFRSADVAHCASLPPSPRSRSSRASCPPQARIRPTSHYPHPLSPRVCAFDQAHVSVGS